MFFGTVVKPGSNNPLVPHADGFSLHLSQASLAADVPTGTRASILVKLDPREEPVVLCTLCAGNQDTVLLDQFMTEYAELSVMGDVPVHLTGYYSPQYDPADDEGADEDEEDEDYAAVRKHAFLSSVVGPICSNIWMTAHSKPDQTPTAWSHRV